MPSVKQLSFKRGEVSPAFRYKASSVAYTEGLHKLRNGYPRRGGGISNRSGFRYLRTLDESGIRPKGIQSNTKLFYQKRKEYLGDDTSRKHSGDIYFFWKTGATSVEILQLFSNFTDRETFLLFAGLDSNRIREMNILSFEDVVYATLRDEGVLKIPYENIFEPRAGETSLGIDAGVRNTVTDLQYRERVQVISDYFYYNTNIVRTVDSGVGQTSKFVRRSLAVTSDGPNDFNRNISAYYVITETKEGGSEQVVCAYHGVATAFQGAVVRFYLVDDAQLSLMAGFQNSDITIRNRNYSFWDGNRQKGLLFITRVGTTTWSDRGDGSGSPSSGGIVYAGPGRDPFSRVLFERIDAVRPVGRYVYRLYRSTNFRGATSLIDAQPVDYAELNTYDGLASFPTLTDFSSASGATSRGFRDGLRLYGGVGNDAIDSRFFDLEQVDYNNWSGEHRLYRPRLPTETSGSYSQFTPFVRVRELMRYQQRTFASYIDKGPIDAENSLRSVIGVSRINSNHDFSTAPVVNPAHAFEFNIPLGDVSTVVAMLGADRPLIFTQQNVYMLLGADSGIITPTEINPSVIYTGGCSETVRPVLVDNQAFFLNNDHTSLVMIAFNASGGRGVQVIETDAFAKHFLEMEITQITVVKSFETIIWLLTSEGKLISMTMYEDGVFGFGLHALSDGFIENITSARYPYMYHPVIRDNAWTTPDVECLAATIVRDGKRTLEVMTGRDDRLSENMGFMDGFTTFGTRLSSREDGYNSDLERGVERFQSIYDPTISGDMKRDLDAVFDAFGNYVRSAVSTINPQSWVQYTWGGHDVGDLRNHPYLQYFLNTTFNDIYRKPYSFAGEIDPNENGGYNDGIETQQRINIKAKDSDGNYTIEFSALHSLYSLIPRGLTARHDDSDESDRQMFLILMYFDILHGFGRSAGFTALSDSRKTLTRRLVSDGYVLNFKSPEYIQYYIGDRYITLRKVSTEDVIIKPDDIDFRRVGTPVSGRPNDAYRIPSTKISTSYGSSTTQGFSNITGGALGSADILIPQQNPARTFLVTAKYAVVGNNEIPEGYLDVENDPNMHPDEQFRRSTNWSPMVNEVTGLTHLAGKKVAVFADNEVISSPLSENKDVASKALTVSDAGVLKLPNYYQWGAVGLPYRFEMESLQIETQDDRALISGRKVINKLNAALHRTREGVRAAAIQGFEYDEVDDESFPMYDESIRESSIDKSNGTFSGVINSFLSAGWSEGGRVRITHSDPTPVTVNAIYPKGIESGD